MDQATEETQTQAKALVENLRQFLSDDDIKRALLNALLLDREYIDAGKVTIDATKHQ